MLLLRGEGEGDKGRGLLSRAGGTGRLKTAEGQRFIGFPNFRAGATIHQSDPFGKIQAA